MNTDVPVKLFDIHIHRKLGTLMRCSSILPTFEISTCLWIRNNYLYMPCVPASAIMFVVLIDLCIWNSLGRLLPKKPAQAIFGSDLHKKLVTTSDYGIALPVAEERQLPMAKQRQFL